jgi:hypothetical protein
MDSVTVRESIKMLAVGNTGHQTHLYFLLEERLSISAPANAHSVINRELISGLRAGSDNSAT